MSSLPILILIIVLLSAAVNDSHFRRMFNFLNSSPLGVGVADLIRLKRVEGPLLIGKRTGLEVGIVLVTPFSSMGEI